VLFLGKNDIVSFVMPSECENSWHLGKFVFIHEADGQLFSLLLYAHGPGAMNLKMLNIHESIWHQKSKKKTEAEGEHFPHIFSSPQHMRA
jgi:hypothetical protein